MAAHYFLLTALIVATAGPVHGAAAQTRMVNISTHHPKPTPTGAAPYTHSLPPAPRHTHTSHHESPSNHAGRARMWGAPRRG